MYLEGCWPRRSARNGGDVTVMQSGPPWLREGSAVPGRRAGERTTKRAQLSRGVGGPWEAGPPHLCSGLVTPAGTGSGPAPCFESLLRPPALCLGPKLALSAAPERERAGCASQVRAAASALRPCQRPAGRAGSNWLGKGEGRGPVRVQGEGDDASTP